MIWRSKVIHLSLFALGSLFLAGVQTALLSRTGPWLNYSLWLLPLVFVLLQRSFITAIVFVYAASFLCGFFTVKPIGLIWLNLFFTSCFVIYFRNKFFGTGPKNFALATFCFCLIYALVDFLLDRAMGEPYFWVHFWSDFRETIGLTVVAPLFYFLFVKFESWAPYDPLLDETKGSLGL